MRPLPSLCALLCLLGTSLAADRPNILLILADDQGYGDVGFNAVPSRQHIPGAAGAWTPNPPRTPHLDAWAADAASLVLTRAYSGSPVCSPTRSSLLTLARDKGIAVREERYSIQQWKADAASGRLREAFACGTAAVVTPIGTVRSPEGEFTIGNGGSGASTEALKATLVGIQRGSAADPYGWIHKVF